MKNKLKDFVVGGVAGNIRASFSPSRF